MEILRQIDLVDLIKRVLAEDVGQGDITTAATVEPTALGRARITVKEPDGIVFCGGMILAQTFSLTASEPVMKHLAGEGDHMGSDRAPNRKRRDAGKYGDCRYAQRRGQVGDARAEANQ